LQYSSTDKCDDLEEIEFNTSIEPKQKDMELRRKSTIGFLSNLISKHDHTFKDIEHRTFNIFDVSKEIDRNHLLPMMTMGCMMKLELLPIVNKDKLALFLDKVNSTYK